MVLMDSRCWAVGCKRGTSSSRMRVSGEGWKCRGHEVSMHVPRTLLAAASVLQFRWPITPPPAWAIRISSTCVKAATSPSLNVALETGVGAAWCCAGACTPCEATTGCWTNLAVSLLSAGPRCALCEATTGCWTNLAVSLLSAGPRCTLCEATTGCWTNLAVSLLSAGPRCTLCEATTGCWTNLAVSLTSSRATIGSGTTFSYLTGLLIKSDHSDNKLSCRLRICMFSTMMSRPIAKQTNRGIFTVAWSDRRPGILEFILSSLLPGRLDWRGRPRATTTRWWLVRHSENVSVVVGLCSSKNRMCVFAVS